MAVGLLGSLFKVGGKAAGKAMAKGGAKGFKAIAKKSVGKVAKVGTGMGVIDAGLSALTGGDDGDANFNGGVAPKVPALTAPGESAAEKKAEKSAARSKKLLVALEKRVSNLEGAESKVPAIQKPNLNLATSDNEVLGDLTLYLNETNQEIVKNNLVLAEKNENAKKLQLDFAELVKDIDLDEQKEQDEEDVKGKGDTSKPTFLAGIKSFADTDTGQALLGTLLPGIAGGITLLSGAVADAFQGLENMVTGEDEETSGSDIATVAGVGAAGVATAVGASKLKKKIGQKAGQEVGQKAGQEVGEKVTKASLTAAMQNTKKEVSEKVSKKIGKEAITSAIEKVAPKALTKLAGKSIPGLSWIVGGGLALYELMRGDYHGAAIEAASSVGGIVTALPGTVIQIARGVYESVYGVMHQNDPEEETRWPELKEQVDQWVSNWLEEEGEKPVNEEALKSAIDKGIYDKDWLGDSEVDLARVNELTEDEIDAILADDDIDKETHNILVTAKGKKSAQDFIDDVNKNRRGVTHSYTPETADSKASPDTSSTTSGVTQDSMEAAPGAPGISTTTEGVTQDSMEAAPGMTIPDRATAPEVSAAPPTPIVINQSGAAAIADDDIDKETHNMLVMAKSKKSVQDFIDDVNNNRRGVTHSYTPETAPGVTIPDRAVAPNVPTAPPTPIVINQGGADTELRAAMQRQIATAPKKELPENTRPPAMTADTFLSA